MLLIFLATIYLQDFFRITTKPYSGLNARLVSECRQTVGTCRQTARARQGCESAVGLHAEGGNRSVPRAEGVKVTAVTREGGVEWAAAGTGVSGTAVGVAQHHATVALYAVSRDRCATGVGDVGEAAVFGYYHPARRGLGCGHRRTNDVEHAAVREPVRRHRTRVGRAAGRLGAAAAIFARCRRCWATPAWARRRSTRMSRSSACAKCTASPTHGARSK